MKCEEWQVILEDYIEGELGENEAAGLRAHLADCPSCAHWLTQLKAEKELYARYERDIQVGPELWSGVRSAIAKEHPVEVVSLGRLWIWLRKAWAVPRFSPAFTVAVVVLGIALTLVVMNRFPSRGPGTTGDPRGQIAQQGEVPPAPGNEKVHSSQQRKPESPGSAQSGPTTAGRADTKIARTVEPKGIRKAVPPMKVRLPRPGVAELVREAEQKYLAAIALLSKDAERRGTRLDPMVKARFEEALAAIDLNIAETRQFARRNPQDPLAVQYLLTAYAKKVDVLKEMARF